MAESRRVRPLFWAGPQNNNMDKVQDGSIYRHVVTAFAVLFALFATACESFIGPSRPASIEPPPPNIVLRIHPRALQRDPVYGSIVDRALRLTAAHGAVATRAIEA